ncbi:stage V sporulation protein D (sporulation-specific penicillin binding protein) [Gracilibacillus halophilus YIM-C55.5]|uniref:serine-type D-Ala-D-Ala carboxypeptidase n=1 Tax=Gracilibacillus halophilus YIM-C55.5 TaxID=1308866 RepID=N4WDI0_9BACI|nr:stage V sporulation protein D [Gracilibacillus halophilus]ENH98333.1 stage V sporulation protein D (sporulation-specific penicillin binding protein) [Gracilibacillus halophilus YIM-C55.5]
MKRVANIMVQKRIVTVFLFAIVIFMMIGFRLGFVQFIQSNFLMEKAEALWSRDIVFEPERGKILDNDEDVLAENVSAPTVMVVPRQISEPEKTAEALARVLDMSYESALTSITKNERIVIVQPEGRKISEETAIAVQTLNLEGVYIAEDSKRHYPHDTLLSHVLGFSGIDNQGLTGLELFYDDQLSGTPGSLSFYSDAKGKRLPQMADKYTAPEDGDHLQLTIDLDVQKIIERELDIAEATYNPDGAIAIAVNPNDGSILGMSSRPNFDPANYREIEPEIYNRNLPIWSTYEPGSTFKIITLAAALEENVVDLEDEEFYDDGDIEVGGTHLHCWKSGGHGQQTFMEVVQNSCNPGFVELGQRLGKEKLFSYIDQFGFGQETGIDLQGEASGILFDIENVGSVELATTSFGQGVSVTPIQQVMAVSAAVNGGYLYEPFIAKGWVDSKTNEVLKQQEPILKDQIISKETSNRVAEALERVVALGTGRSAYVEGYRVGGKTGTAQKVGPDGSYLENNHIVSFIGFAPANDPEIVVYVAIDNPKDTVQFGGVVSAPIVGTIINDSLRALGVEKQDNGIEKDYQWPDTPKIEVPDLVGLHKKELQKQLMSLQVDLLGEGEYIIDQAPAAGEQVEEGSEIRLVLGEK